MLTQNRCQESLPIVVGGTPLQIPCAQEDGHGPIHQGEAVAPDGTRWVLTWYADSGAR